MATLIVGDLTPRVQYTASGGQTVFVYNFPIFQDSDLKVYVNDTLQTLTTDYTVSGAGTSTGGLVTFNFGRISGVIITILRDLPIERTTDYQANGDLLAENLNDDLDRLTMMSQQLESELNRCAKLSEYSTGSTQDLVENLETMAQHTDAIDAIALDLTGGTFDQSQMYDLGSITTAATGLTGAPNGFIVTVYNNLADINTVATDIADVSTVAADIADVTTVATDLAGADNIGTVAASIADVNTVAGIDADVTAVAAIAADVTAVAAIDSDVTAVAADATDIGTVATNIADVNAVATALTSVPSGASLVTYDNATSGLTATDVQAAIDEIVTAAVNAINVIYDNTTSGMTATDVQAAIDELKATTLSASGGTITGNTTFTGNVTITGTLNAGSI